MVMLSLALARMSRRSLVRLSDQVTGACRRHRSRRDLASLDERTMKDIGLVPLDIDYGRERSPWERYRGR